MALPHTSRSHAGHTLMELVAAMVAGSILLAGLGAVMFIARQIAYTPAAASKRVDSARAVNEMADELRYATYFVTHTLHAVEFVVADRNSDGAAERIRYEWSGTAGAPLMKTVNGGTPFAVVSAINDFQAIYTTTAQTTSVSTSTTTSESLLASNTSSPSSSGRNINPTNLSAQRINSTAFSSVPAGATTWNATKVDFYGKKSSSATETLRVQIRSSGDPRDSPTGQILGEIAVPETSLASSTAGWNTATFANPVTGLSLSRMYDLVWTGTTGETNDCLQLSTDGNAVTNVNESSDAGASWQYMPDTRSQTFYRVYGTYTKPGTSYNVTRNYVSRVAIVLQPADAAHSRINTSIPLVTTPELLTGYWRADFDTDPTALDVTRDGTKDWVTASGSAFNTAKLVGGVWQANDALQTRPLNNFTTVTTVEARCRNTSVGGNGTVIQINGDRQSGVYGPVFAYVQLQSDGSQTLTLYGRSNDATNVSLYSRKLLTSGFLRLRMTIVPQYHIVNLQINDEDVGAFAYPTYAPSASDGYVTAFTNTSNSEFDYLETRVSE